jgi:hypothetical protein
VPSVVITGWLWDEGNLTELACHGLSRRIVIEVAHEDPKFRRNRRGKAVTHQMIGPDYGMRMWTVCIATVFGHMGLWRAITGWSADPEDVDWYGKW